MTKVRPPLSFERALTQVAGLIGWKAVVGIVGRAERTVRAWGDHDTSRMVTLEAALKLDVAYQEAGGDGAPFHQCYSTRLEADTAEALFCAQRLASAAAKAARESGEATEAAILASRPGASFKAIARAALEIEEAIAAHTNTLAILGAGPGSDVSLPGGNDA